VDAIVAFVFGGGSIQLMKQARDFGLTPDVELIVLSVLDDNLVNQVGDAGEGVVTFAHYTPHDDDPVNEAFVDAYVARFDQLPGAWSVDGWLAAKAIGDAMVAIDGDVEDTAAFSAAIQDVSFPSPRGPFRFEENGFAEVTMYIMRAERAPTGELQIIRQGENVGTFNSAGLISR
jgi:branched-chain amino acid transport system substrate-binding protein